MPSVPRPVLRAAPKSADAKQIAQRLRTEVLWSRVAQDPQLLRQTTLGDGRQEVLLFVPPSIVRDLEYPMAREIEDALLRDGARFYRTKVGDIAKSLGLSEHGRTSVALCPLSWFAEARERMELHSLLVGIRLGNPLRESPNPEKDQVLLSARIEVLRQDLIEGFFKGLARRFARALSERPEQTLANVRNVGGNYEILGFIPVRQMQPHLRQRLDQEIDASGTHQFDQPSHADSPYFLLDKTTNKPLTVPYGTFPQGDARSAQTILHDQILQTVETIAGQEIAAQNDRMPFCIPNPRIMVEPQYQFSGDGPAVLMGIAIGVLFAASSFDRSAMQTFRSDTLCFSRERMERVRA